MRGDFIFYGSVASINGEAAGDRIRPRSTAIAFPNFRFRSRHRSNDIVARAVNRELVQPAKAPHIDPTMPSINKE